MGSTILEFRADQSGLARGGYIAEVADPADFFQEDEGEEG